MAFEVWFALMHLWNKTPPIDVLCYSACRFHLQNHSCTAAARLPSVSTGMPAAGLCRSGHIKWPKTSSAKLFHSKVPGFGKTSAVTSVPSSPSPHHGTASVPQ